MEMENGTDAAMAIIPITKRHGRGSNLEDTIYNVAAGMGSNSLRSRTHRGYLGEIPPRHPTTVVDRGSGNDCPMLHTELADNTTDQVDTTSVTSW